MDLLIQDVRSFRGIHEVPLRPLTLLVGENSAGKTTLLSMIAAVFNEKFPARSLFNHPPYDLGTFDTIATNSGGRWRSDCFSIGFTENTREGKRTVKAVFNEVYGQPRLATFSSGNDKGELLLDLTKNNFSGELHYKNEDKTLRTIRFSRESKFAADIEISLQSIFPLVHEKFMESSKGKTKQTGFGILFGLLQDLLAPPEKSAISIAPVRTKPKRTYDELIEDFSPEGNHIPLILARALEKTEPTKKIALVEALKRFGLESGLYKNIEIKRLGKRPSDPFQVKVKASGPSRNLTDVGYGVSQSLPVIVESVLCSSAEMMLLQQPEVHLHPRAQAALGTFLSDLVSTQKKSFVVETHSDYLIDRVRQEVAANRVNPDKVLLLFLDKTGSDTGVHPIDLDNQGNVINPPKSYRQFFLQEELSLLLRGK